MINRLPVLSAALAVATALLFVPAPGQAADPAGTPPEGAAPAGDWRVGALVNKDGAFAYCVAESRFTNGQSLVIARNGRNEFNLGLGMPEARLTRGAAWKVVISVDGALKRERQAVAADPDMLVIANGDDRELYDAIGHGSSLAIAGPTDTITFQLVGTGKALRDLRTCTERASAGQPYTPLGRIGGDKPVLPPLLKELLSQAGLKKIDLLPVSAAPPGHAAADAVWRVSPVVSGISKTSAQTGDTVASLSEAYLTRLKARCTKDFQVDRRDPETLPAATLRLAEIACTDAKGAAVQIALTFDLSRGGLLQVFFHEAPAADAAAVIHARDAIADVLRRLANP